MATLKLIDSDLSEIANVDEQLEALAAPSTDDAIRDEVERRLAEGEKVTAAQIEDLRRKVETAERTRDHATGEAAAHADRVKELEAKGREALSVEVDAAARKIEQSHADEEARLKAEIRATRSPLR